MKSLDPRVNRLPEITTNAHPKAPLDQFGTFEVFVQPRAGKPFQHEGSVHAPNLEMAYVLAKETFTRRFTCTDLCVTDTRNVFVSPMTEGNVNAYDRMQSREDRSEGELSSFEIFHLMKRGKQHIHAGQVEALNPADAMIAAKEKLRTDAVVFNVWAIRTSDIRYTTPDEKDFWLTLPDKKFRDAAAYKAGDKLQDFLQRQ